MRWSRRLGWVALTTLATVLLPLPAAASTTTDADPSTTEDPSWIAVVDSPDAVVAAVVDAAFHQRAEIEHVFDQAINGFSFRGSDDAVAGLLENPTVVSVSPSREFRVIGEAAPNGILRMSAWAARQAGYDGKMSDGTRVRIAVLDTGVLATHPDLVPNMSQGLGKNCIGTGAPHDGHSHGTHVSGTAAAAFQGEGVIGVATDAEIVPVKVMSDAGVGTDEQIICGLEYVLSLVDDGVPIVVNFK